MDTPETLGPVWGLWGDEKSCWATPKTWRSGSGPVAWWKYNISGDRWWQRGAMEPPPKFKAQTRYRTIKLKLVAADG